MYLVSRAFIPGIPCLNTPYPVLAYPVSRAFIPGIPCLNTPYPVLSVPRIPCLWSFKGRVGLETGWLCVGCTLYPVLPCPIT